MCYVVGGVTLFYSLKAVSKLQYRPQYMAIILCFFLGGLIRRCIYSLIV